MKIRLLPGIGKTATLALPPDVLKILNLKAGDYVQVDVSNSGYELLVWKDGSKPGPTMKGVKEIVKS